MKSKIQCAALILAAAALSIVCGCVSSTEQYGEKPRSQMTVRQARKAFAESLRDTHRILPLGIQVEVREIKIKRDRATWDEVAEGESYHFSLAFSEVTDMRVEEYATWALISYAREGSVSRDHMRTRNKATAIRFVDAVLTLKAAALLPGSDESDFAAFSENAKVWLATASRPEMSDDARTLKLLAEDAFKRKDFAGALNAYREALELNPMWPEGQYNAALLAAELNDYGSAADHMRRYLVLVPNAKDARSAKDKLLLWQHKANE